MIDPAIKKRWLGRLGFHEGNCKDVQQGEGLRLYPR